MVDQVFSRVHVAMGLRMILTLEKWFTASTFQFVSRKRKGKGKKERKKKRKGGKVNRQIRYTIPDTLAH